MENSEDMEIPPLSKLYPRSHPDPEAVTKAASLLANAKNSVIYVGDRVAQSQAVAEVVALAEMLGAKVYAARMTELNFPMNHPLFMGVNMFGDEHTAKLLDGVDIALVVGANLGIHMYQHQEIPYPSDTKIIHLDVSLWEVGKNYPTEMGLIADCKAGLRELTDAIRDIMSDAQRRAAANRAATVGQKTAEMRERANKKALASWDDVPISLPRLMKEIRDAIAPGTVITSESVTAWPALRQYIEPSEPGTYFTTQAGALGWGMSAPLGIKLALPERPVVAVVGDGAAMYSIQALWTAAHYHIPVTYIICNNARYDTLRDNWKVYRGREPGRDWLRNYVELENPKLNFAKIAEALGVPGQRVEKPAELAPALKEALQLKEPAMVDVVTQPVG